MLTRTIVKIVVGLSAAVFVAPAALAGFDTYTNDWSNDKSIVDEAPPVPEFATTEIVVPPVDPNAYVIADTYGRLYVRFGVNTGITQLVHIRNKSYAPLSFNKVLVDSVKRNTFDWEIGAGAKVSAVRYELVYLHHKSMAYDPSPVLSGTKDSLSSTVNNYGLMANLYWDFDAVKDFQPYIGGMLGWAWNKTRSSLSGPGIINTAFKDSSKFGVAWGASIGARRALTKNCLAYIQYTYTAQGKVTWKDISSAFNLQGQYVFSAFSIGINYII